MVEPLQKSAIKVDPFSLTTILGRPALTPCLMESLPRTEAEKKISMLQPSEQILLSLRDLNVEYRKADAELLQIKISCLPSPTARAFFEVTPLNDSVHTKAKIRLHDSGGTQLFISSTQTLPVGTQLSVNGFGLNLSAPQWFLKQLASRTPDGELVASAGLSGSSHGSLTGRCLHGNYAGYTWQGIPKVGSSVCTNEDAFLVVNGVSPHNMQIGRTSLIVMDGIGGHVGGEIAVEEASASLSASLQQGAPFESATLNVLKSLVRRNRRHCEDVRSTQDFSNMGLCLSALEVFSNHCVSHHAGDSKTVVIRPAAGDQPVQLLYESSSHNPVQERLIKGLCSIHEVRDQQDLNRVSSSLSLKNGMIDRSWYNLETSQSIPLRQGDFVVIASDGMWDNFDMHPGGVLEAIQPESTPLNVLEVLVRRTALEMESARGRHDNVSIIVYQHGVGSRC